MRAMCDNNRFLEKVNPCIDDDGWNHFHGEINLINIYNVVVAW